MAREPKTRGEANIKWCEDHLYLPDGRYIGRQLQMAGFMKSDFLAIYDNPRGLTRRAIISRGRKNAKTVECAFINLLHLCGPEARPNSQLYSCAQSRDQAAVLFDYAAKMVRISPILRQFIRIKDTAKELHCPELGTMYKALSAESSTALGRNPALAIHDELGQVRGPRFPLFEALETATGTQEDPLTVIISTQAATDADLLSILIDDAKAGHDPRIVLRFDAAPLNLDPFGEDAIRAANPAFDVFMNQKEVLAMAAEAKRMPAREAEFRNLILNQRVEAASLFIKPMSWQMCNAPVADLDGRECYAGLDLSEASDLTALVLISNSDHVWNVEPTFWLPGEGIEEKSKADRVPYDLWAKQGFLKLTPGKSVQYQYVARYLVEHVFPHRRIKKIGFDRWNFKHFKPWLLATGLSEQFITEHFVEFGQGTQSMSPALRELESIILEQELAHGDHPVLNMCAANAVVEGHDASNRKLSKKRSTGRIDGMVALAMAIGVAPLRAAKVDIEALIG
jgi:phage terminase large subunit-like protein